MSFAEKAIAFLYGKQILELSSIQVGTKEGRMLAATYAREFYNLEEAQLVCLLYSPFLQQGQKLEVFLRRCHPGMLVALPELHKVLQGKPGAEMIQQWVVHTSGLPLELLQHLYRTSLPTDEPCRPHDQSRGQGR